MNKFEKEEDADIVFSKGRWVDILKGMVIVAIMFFIVLLLSDTLIKMIFDF